jgi:hypothetical protein
MTRQQFCGGYDGEVVEDQSVGTPGPAFRWGVRLRPRLLRLQIQQSVSRLDDRAADTVWSGS